MDGVSEGQQRDALAEGRRIYLGNLLYSVRPGDIENLLRQEGFGQFEKLHISVDPVSGRNPGYCFIEFAAREEADRALNSLPGTPLFGRPVKTGPCHPKSSPQSRWSGSRGADYTPTFQRWGDWDGAAEADKHGQDQQGPYAAVRHLETRSSRPRDQTQLFIAGLGKMISQEHHDTEMRELLAGFDVVAVGKRITPSAETRALPGNQHYCFVDFSSHREAERAMAALHGKPVPGGRLRVSFARSPTRDVLRYGVNRGNPDGTSRDAGPPTETARKRQDGQEQRRGQTDRQQAIMASNNWRSGSSANAL
ncbi:hypothetical protein VTK56DRAFT_6980 [Thermocarpiscus australiensis]